VSRGNVSNITMKGYEVTGRFKNPVKGKPTTILFLGKETPKYRHFKTTIPSIEDPKLIEMLEKEDVIKNEEKNVIAYHEAGHALVAGLLPCAEPLEKVSIIPRGRSLGATEQIPEEDHHNLGRSYLFDHVAVILGGRAAEKKMIFDDNTTGPGDDL
jgi:ATP-dependent Zn protease